MKKRLHSYYLYEQEKMKESSQEVNNDSFGVWVGVAKTSTVQTNGLFTAEPILWKLMLQFQIIQYKNQY